MPNYIWENNQTITFTAITGKTTGGAAFTCTAVSSSALPVVLTSNTPTICTVLGKVVTMAGATGTASITANCAADHTWYAAPPVTRTFAVTTA